MACFIAQNKNTYVDTNEHVLLFEEDGHKIYWMGIEEESAFRCNVYLIEDDGEFIIVDPGSRIYHQELKNRISHITDPKNISGLIICHQDPDVAASMVDWLEINENIKIITSTRTNVLLPYYGKAEYEFYNIAENSEYTFASGRRLKFIESPFLHFPGAFTTLDESSGFLFSGDIFAALDINWKLIVNNFEDHIPYLDLFHVDYMPSNIATSGYAKRIEKESINAILPQHGSIIDKNYIKDAIEYLKNLRCGLDIIYAANE